MAKLVSSKYNDKEITTKSFTVPKSAILRARKGKKTRLANQKQNRNCLL